MNDPAPQQLLRDVFGYETFRGEQRAIIEHVATGAAALALIPCCAILATALNCFHVK